MKIVFLRDTMPIVQTGNEYYPAGVDADLRDGHAQWLIDNGYARPYRVVTEVPQEVQNGVQGEAEKQEEGRPAEVMPVAIDDIEPEHVLDPAQMPRRGRRRKGI